MRGLAGKLIVLLVIAGVLPVLTAGAIALVLAREAAAAAVREGNRQVARRAALQLGAAVEHARDLLRAAGDNRLRDELTPAQERRLLLSLKLQFRVLSSITRVDAAGAPVVWTDLARPALAPDLPPVAAALRGEPYTGTIATDGTLVPRVSIALPLRAGGALIATLDLVDVWRIVDDIKVGATGRAVLLDRDGRLVAHGAPDGKRMVLRRAPLVPLAAAARAAAAEGTLLEGVGSLGRPALSVAVTVPGTPWFLVLEQDQAEAFSGVSRLSLALVALAVGSALAAALLGSWQARRRVLAPVRALEEAARAYGADRLDHRVAVRTGDELEDLGRALEDLARHVASARGELQRTARARALGMLAGGLAHDLKHPVATFQALLLRAERLGPDLDRRLAEAVRRETPRLAALVEQLGELGRAGARRDTEFAAGALAEAADAFRERGAIVVVDAPAGALPVRADRHMLARALENLLSNAHEASPPGGTILLVIAAAGGRLEIAVSDEGPGLPAGALEDFASSKPGGLGLGLTVVRQVAEAHGGEVIAEGSRLAMRLPILAS